MSTIELGGFAATKTNETNRLAAAFAGLFAAWRARREQKRTLRLLRQLDARTLRDMGFEPAEIYGTQFGISAIHGDSWKGLDK